VFLCSFDIASLFTNVPLAKTIQICVDALYITQTYTLILSTKDILELMKMATRSVEFSFNDVIYQQTNSIAMGSPSVRPFAKIFVGYHESIL